MRNVLVLLLASALGGGCVLAPQPAPSGYQHPWSIRSNGAPVRAGEDVRIVLTYRPWGSRPVPNRVDFYAVCIGCPGVAGSPVDSALGGYFLLTPEQCSDASRGGPGPDSAICWSVPINFPYAGRWRFTTPLDVNLDVGPATAAATPTAPSASVCGRLVSHVYDGYRHQIALEVLSVDQASRTFEYQLVGPGTLPSDLAEQFASQTRQTLFVSGSFDAGTGRPIAVRNYDVMRITGPCPTAR